MSITGYTREDTKKLKFTDKDDRLDELKKISVNKEIIIVASAPIEINNDLFIGSFIFSPTVYKFGKTHFPHELVAIWNSMRNALMMADEIVIIGYSFPNKFRTQ